MKANAISRKILEDARAAAALQLKEASERADSMKKSAELKMEEKRVQLNNQTEQESRTLRSRMLRMAELDQKKALLQTKREVIEQVFETTLEGMRRMPEDQRRAYNRRILIEAALGGEEIICAKDEAQLFDGQFISSVNSELAKSGRAGVKLSRSHRQTGGGFILKSTGMEINCTYSVLIGQARPALESEVAQMLFGREVF